MISSIECTFLPIVSNKKAWTTTNEIDPILFKVTLEINVSRVRKELGQRVLRFWLVGGSYGCEDMRQE